MFINENVLNKYRDLIETTSAKHNNTLSWSYSIYKCNIISKNIRNMTYSFLHHNKTIQYCSLVFIMNVGQSRLQWWTIGWLHTASKHKSPKL